MPNRHGPTGPCGCCGDCFIAEDNFDRPNSPLPGGEFVLLYYTGGIVNNTLVVNATGQVATIVCHPNAYDLGSFVSYFDLVDPEDGDVYVIACGNPNDPKMTVTYSFYGTPGLGGYVTIEIDSDGETVQAIDYPDTIQIDWPVSTLVSARICYAPGLTSSALISFDGSTAVPSSEVCIDEGNTAPCWDATDVNGDPVRVGNFSFLEGHFDNWEYYVNYVDNPSCILCSCNCIIQPSENVFEESCIPKTVNLTIGSHVDCTGLAGTYALIQRIKRDSPVDTAPDVDAFQEKITWVSNPIACPSDPDYNLVFELVCGGATRDTATDTPNFQLFCHKFADGGTGNIADSNFGFDADDPFTVQGGDLVANTNPSYANCKSGTCDPILLNFPDLVENSYSAGDPAQGAVACCGGYISSGGSYEPSLRFTVVVTE